MFECAKKAASETHFHTEVVLLYQIWHFEMALMALSTTKNVSTLMSIALTTAL